jgi:cysteine desulfurase
MDQIYLDYNASTPIAVEVTEAMRPYLAGSYGNPSSAHWAGPPARTAVEAAREDVAALLGATPGELVFTSGGSEANNYALKGAFFARQAGRDRIIISAIEHPSIEEPCRFLETLGARITRLPVDRCGRVDPATLAATIGPDTAIVSIMHANNEVGTIQPIADCARIAHDCGALLHTDAAQSIGKIAVNVDDLGVDLLTVAGHKLYAPKGVGALYVRSGVRLEPLIHGAGHEAGRRAGTESALLTVALGAAARLARDLAPMERVAALRDRLWAGLAEGLGDRVVRNGDRAHLLPNTLNVCFGGTIGADLLARLDGIAASTGSACHDGKVALSPTLAAMGVDPSVGAGAVRFSLGRGTTAAEIEATIERVVAQVG